MKYGEEEYIEWELPKRKAKVLVTLDENKYTGPRITEERCVLKNVTLYSSGVLIDHFDEATVEITFTGQKSNDEENRR